MKLQTAERLKQVETYYFATKLKEVATLKASGKPIISLAIGSPDLPPPDEVLQSLKEALSEPMAHSYQPYHGTPELREAIQDFYAKFLETALNSDTEILPLMGSKEAIMHISMAFLNPQDEVLIPNPGYITYTSVAKLLQAKPLYYELSAKNNWLPDCEYLEKQDLSKVKMMWINYPHMPTGAKASKADFKKLIGFTQKHHILLVNDNPYAFVLNENPMSILNIKGAKKMALELNSLSKSHNMAGWRVGMVLGAKEYIDAILKIKSNMDSGMFYGVQKGAITALKQPLQWFEKLNKTYKERREVIWKILDRLGCEYDKNSVGMFVWAKLPKGLQEVAFADELLYKKHIFITPGTVFGTAGKGYIRLSLCVRLRDLQKVLKRI